MEPRSWSPHPMHRPGLHLTGLAHLALGTSLLLDTYFDGWMSSRPLGGALLAVAVAFVGGVALAGALRHRPHLRVVALVGVPGLAAAAHLAVRAFTGGFLAPGTMPGVALVATAVFVLVVAERRRREVRVSVDDDRLDVFVRRYRLVHELPFETVRDMTASRTFWGRLWGYGDFEAKVRKGAMKDHVTRPVVGEEPPEGATRGNGWDEEERFHLVAAHPYRAVRRDLEHRIVLARMSPKEREEARLADRLAEDLDVIGST